MINLDDLTVLGNIDKSQMLESIRLMTDQCKQAWDESTKIDITQDMASIQNIVIAGMGGSALGPHIIQSVFGDRLKLPIEVVRDYKVPGYVNSNSLVILTSYSGTTEETLAAAEDAKKKGAKILGISKGGSLQEWINANGYQGYFFDPKNNPSNSPRMAVGYSIFGILGLLTKVGGLTFEVSELDSAVSQATSTWEANKPEVPLAQNPAKTLAQKLHNHIVVIFAAEHLSGNAHVFANQVNETAKTHSAYHLLSELNHHLLEGFNYPGSLKETIALVMFESDSYIQRQKDRVEITTEVVKNRGVAPLTFKPSGHSKLDQVLETLAFSGLVSYYMAMLSELDPTPNPDVDFLKDQLNQKGAWNGRV